MEEARRSVRYGVQKSSFALTCKEESQSIYSGETMSNRAIVGTRIKGA